MRERALRFLPVVWATLAAAACDGYVRHGYTGSAYIVGAAIGCLARSGVCVVYGV